MQKITARLLFLILYKTNSKWTQDFHAKLETFKLLVKNRGNTSRYWHRQWFSEQEFNSIVNKSKNLQMEPHQISKFLHKGTISRAKRQPIQWKKISASYLFNRGLIFRIKKINNKNWQLIWIDTSKVMAVSI
jgi:hypothetical protein